MPPFAFPAYRGRFYPAYAARADALSLSEVEEWIRIGDAQPPEPATIGRPDGANVVDDAVRKARVSWIYPEPATRPIFERLTELALRLNAESFGFDLVGFAEALQFTVYEAPSVGYDWHIDMIDAPTALQRKLSLTVQLSAAEEYDGGDLEVRDGYEEVTAPRDRGSLVAFPSWALHRVAPLGRGVRRSIVAWIGGPPFR
jgi:PKHD-type hydroxylase